MVRLVLDAIRLALAAILRSKTRAALTVLGILIGIAAVVTVTALTAGYTSTISSQLESVGANIIYISPQSTQASGARSKATGRLTEADGRAIARDAVSVSAVAPWLSTTAQVIYQDKNVQTTVAGTTLSYFPIRKFRIGKGEAWTEGDELLKTKVCVIGATVAQNLFGNEDPVGRTVRIGSSPYRVIGTLAPRGTSTFGDDQDDRVLMPIGSFRARVMHTSPGRADMLLASATSDKTVARATAQIAAILRERHRIASDREPDFRIDTMAEMQKAFEGVSMALRMLLLSVAGVSLLVGGVGIMNIMLVSVAERTREIGIRMSIGARERDILTQFLIEAVVLSLFGGALGILAGVGLTLGIGQALDVPAFPNAEALVVAVVTSTGIGILFGYLPARRAAKMDPIEALRVDA